MNALSEAYDVVVIGAGLGGLSAAAFLAKKGLSVLLAERHHAPGGYASTFVRGRFEFEVSLHELSGMDPEAKKGGLYHYLEWLGVTRKVKFIKLKTLYKSVFPDLEITLPVGREEVERVLSEHFPHESEGIHRIFDRIFLTYKALAMLQKGASELTQEFLRSNLLDYMDKTWGEVLNNDVKDPKARAVISQLWGYFGLPPSRISYIFHAIGLASYVKLGPTQVKGKSQALSNAFVDVIEEAGGEVRLGCGVSKILVEEGRVSGVVTDQGEEVRAKYVVSNVNPITVCKELIGTDKVPESYLERLNSSELAPSTINVYMGLDCPYTELGVDEFETFLNEDYDYDRQFEKAWTLEPPGSMSVTTYNLADPDFSPPGTSVVVLTTLSYADPWLRLNPREYYEAKTGIAEKMIEQAEKVAPGLREHIEVVEVATPITNIRYTGNYGGSIYGFNQTPKDNMLIRLPHEGPIRGLYFAGAWTQPGGGYEPCILSGSMAAQKLLSSMEKEGK
nr:NAD(P)/FAD-dependent oxidoreductase [Candidatus Freyrarchaeum guaymaensis]